jgi:hypothetical protein
LVFESFYFTNSEIFKVKANQKEKKKKKKRVKGRRRKEKGRKLNTKFILPT